MWSSFPSGWQVTHPQNLIFTTASSYHPLSQLDFSRSYLNWRSGHRLHRWCSLLGLKTLEILIKIISAAVKDLQRIVQIQ
jgi:hypothetical protein